MSHIIVTIGPAINTEDRLTKLYTEGARILRFNFSHYNAQTASKEIEVIRKVEKKIGEKFSLLLDTEGPGIRTGFLSQAISYETGDEFKIFTDEKLITAGEKNLFCDYPFLIQDVYEGGTIKIDSGLFEVTVMQKGSDYILVKAKNNFLVGSRRHINLPGVTLKLPTIGDKDKEDVLFAIKNKFEYIDMSFTRSKQDVKDLRVFLAENEGEHIKIISKIESQEGVDNVNEIIDASDMIMVARGDLGTELPIETIPGIQMNIVKKCKQKQKKVIVATQMLETMITNRIPTRAEVSDIFYAVLQGADYVMLSGETAVGKYPISCVKIMNKVIVEANKYVE
ncbi:MAG: pyruvate kinase [Candidatus Absconditabacterales bacterium]